ncbi:hypothetical protein GCM10027075_77600 [Streptomyces heilongjiangensis]
MAWVITADGRDLSPRKSATAAGAPTGEARVCLAQPPTGISHASFLLVADRVGPAAASSDPVASVGTRKPARAEDSPTHCVVRHRVVGLPWLLVNRCRDGAQVV